MAERKRLLELAISGIQREIHELEDELKGLGKGIMRGFAVAGAVEMGMPPPRTRPRKRRMSADARARISAAQKARWAKRRKASRPAKAAGKKSVPTGFSLRGD
jgi:hypothetical protein